LYIMCVTRAFSGKAHLPLAKNSALQRHLFYVSHTHTHTHAHTHVHCSSNEGVCGAYTRCEKVHSKGLLITREGAAMPSRA